MPELDGQAIQLAIQKALDYHRAGRLNEAEAIYREILRAVPSQADVLHFLGVLEHQRGNLDGAIELIEDAIRINPTNSIYYCNRGRALKDSGRPDQAIVSYEQALLLNPDFAEAWTNLGNARKALGMRSDAIDAYRRALAINVGLTDAHFNLGVTLNELGEWAEAIDAFRQVVVRQPDHYDALCNLAASYLVNGQPDEAVDCCRRAISLRPLELNAYNNLAHAQQDLGYLDDALDSYRKVLSLRPDFATGHSNLLFCLNYHTDSSPEEIYTEYRRWNECHANPLSPTRVLFANSRDSNRRLRIGYVSPDLRRHSSRHFVEPLFQNHNFSHFDVFAYADVASEDDVSAALRSEVGHWRNTLGLSDAALAEQIRRDQIDILVDLAGHTAGNRLLVFARRPAPIQVSWLGYGYTTGLDSIDYFFGDENLTPMGCEHLFSETIIRLPVFATYLPPSGMGDPSALPASRSRCVTFGTLSRSVRLNHRVLRVWARILHRVPDSLLLINSANFRSLTMQDRLRKQFGELGIDSGRLILGYESPPWEVLRRIDIALDCFPHNSGTTLFEGLYMGVPFVTLAGRVSVGRLGAAILTAIGYSQWIAYSEDEYVDKAADLAENLEELESIRAVLRQKMSHSPLMNGPYFAQSVESAYRGMWDRWCEEQAALNLTVQNHGDLERSEALAAYRRGESEVLERYCRKCLEINPNDEFCAGNLSTILVERRDYLATVDHCFRAIEIMPRNRSLYVNLCLALGELRRWQEAYDIGKRAVELFPESALAWTNFASPCLILGRMVEAENAARRALQIEPNRLDALNNLASALKDQGKVREAVETFRRMTKLAPEYDIAPLNLLLTLQYDETEPVRDIVEVAKQHGSMLEARSTRVTEYDNDPDPCRRLRIGFLSPDFRDNAVMYFAEPLLARLDRNEFEVFCYYLAPPGTTDSVTERVKRLAERFQYLGSFDLNEKTNVIRHDKIDILVDLAGPTARDGLAVMANCPAPVQCNWLGYPGTTGLKSIAWRFTDAVADPPGSEDEYTENLIRLPGAFCVYRPCIREPQRRYWPDYQVRPAPAIANGYVTFGSCNNLAKITPRVLETWAELLRRLPNARLLIEGKGFHVGSALEEYRQHCVRFGIDSERLILIPRSLANQYLTYHHIDIALDSFPLTGGTTTFDVLWMGLPLITMAGASFRSRMSMSFLTSLSMTDLIATDVEDYLRIAVRQASDIEALNTRRMQQRALMAKSPLMDEARFAGFFGDGLRQTWRRWCATRDSDVCPGLRKVRNPELVDVQLATRERISIEDARRRLQRALELALGLSNNDQGCLAPDWLTVADIADAILTILPYDPQALVASAQADYAKGQLLSAIGRLSHAIDQTPYELAWYEHLIHWWTEAGNLGAAAAVRTIRENLSGPLR